MIVFFEKKAMADYRHRLQSGFTLIEMMVVVAIMGIIAAIAYPSMQKQIGQMQLKDAVNTAETALKQARTDAIVRREKIRVTLDSSRNIMTFTPVIKDISGKDKDDTDNKQIKSFNKNIIVSAANNLPENIIFNINKQILDKDSNILTFTDKNMGYAFCVKGLQKYIVTLDALNNIVVVEDGVCS